MIRKGSEVSGRFTHSSNLGLVWVRTKLYTQLCSFFPSFLRNQRFQKIMMLPPRKHTLGGALPPGGWCFWKFQTLKDFIKLLSMLLACCTSTLKPLLRLWPHWPPLDPKVYSNCWPHAPGPREPCLEPRDFVDNAICFQENSSGNKTALLSDVRKIHSSFAAEPPFSQAGSSALVLQPGCVHTAGEESGQKGPGVSLG